jgi:hypothetical protein
VAVAAGGGLAVAFLRGPAAPRPPWPIAAAHGAIGTAGLALLLVALGRGAPPSTAGTTGFGPAAALLFALALAFGLAIAIAAVRRRRPAGLLVAIHASLAVAGFVVLWTVVSLG